MAAASKAVSSVVAQSQAATTKYVNDKKNQMTSKLTTSASSAVSKAVSTATKAQQTANQISGSLKNISSQVGGTAGKAVSSIQGQLNNVSTKLASTATNVTKQAQQAVNNLMSKFTSNVTSTLGGILNQATSILGKPISSFSSMFPNVAKTIFASKNGDNTILSTLTNLGTGDIDSKISSILSDGMGALSTPVSFISKPIDDVMQGISTMAMGSRMSDLLDELAADQLRHIEQACGLKIASQSDLNKAIREATNSFYDKNRVSSSVIAAWEQTHLTPSTSTPTTYVSSLITGARSLLRIYEPTSESFSSIDSNSTAVSVAALGTLASRIQSKLSINNPEVLSKEVSICMEEDASSFDNASKLVTEEVLDEDTLTGMVVGLDQSNNYPAKTTEDGASLLSSFGSNPQSTIEALYGIAQTVCPSIQTLATTNYRNTKDLYDILIALTAAFGVPDLLSQLLYYGNTDGTKLLDDRTKTLLQEAAEDVAMKGDVFTLGVIVRELTAANVLDRENLALILDANMTTDEAKTDAYKAILDVLGLDLSDLVEDKDYSSQVLSGNNIVLMSTTNTEVVDEAVTTNVRSLIQTAVAAYAQVASTEKTHAERVAAAAKAA